MTGDRPLPTDWSSRTIAAAADKIIDFRGRTPKKLGMSWGGGDIPAISARNVRMGYIDFAEEFHVAADALYRRWMTQGDMERGDALITTEAPLGNVAAVPDDRRYVLSQRVVLIRPRLDILDKTYFVKILQSPGFQSLLNQNASGSTAVGIQRKRLERLPIPVPPLAEQRQIGQSLQDADDLIAALERLIAKKHAIKQGMMQQLLTGRTQLAGFDDEWTDARISSLARVTGGGTPSTRVPSFWGGSIPWFTPAEILADGSGLVSKSERTISSEGLAHSSATLLPAGSVLVTSRASIGNCAVAAAPVTTNQGFASMVPIDGRSTWFLYYWTQQHKSELASRAAGSTFLEISASKVAGIPMRRPALDEQRAIGMALRSADDELDALRLRLTKARAIKTGMMQQLLTGRVRLPVEAAS